VQSIEARLWQDPFGVVSKNGLKPDKTPGTAGARRRAAAESLDSSRDPEAALNLADLCSLVGDQPGTVKVMIALVLGGTWVGADEGRRRARYATLAGLNAEGYVPDDPEHIGYAEQRWSNGWLARLPFEWLSSRDGKDGVLLLWVDEESLQEAQGGGRKLAEPLSRLSLLIQRMEDFIGPGKARYIIIGPSSSTFLKTAVGDPCLSNPSGCRETLEKLEVHWYSPMPLCPTAILSSRRPRGEPSY